MIIALALASCGAPISVEPDGGACDGSLPASCDGERVWRCVEGRWLADSPVRPCLCFDAACTWVGP